MGHLKYTKDYLQELVNSSNSVSDIVRKLGLNPSGGSHPHISKRIKMFGIDTSKFAGLSWSKGKRREEFEKPPSVILTENSTPRAHQLRRSLVAIGRIYECESCEHKGDWAGKPLVLEVHHKNGNRRDNRAENLQFLCPNCHSQTPNFGFKGSGPQGGL